MVHPTTLEVILEFALHIAGQFTALLRQMSRERRVVFFDDLIEKGLLGTVVLVTTSIRSRVAILAAAAWGMIRAL